MPERWLNDGEVFCWDVLSLKNVSSFSFILEPFVGSSLKFFVEGSILAQDCLLYTSPSPRDGLLSRMPSSA